MKKKLASFLFIALIVSANPQGSAIAQVYLSGSLSNVLVDTTYIVIGDIYVRDRDSLLVEPGSIFLFDGEYNFDIYGYLHAVGTESDSIVFQPTEEAEYWCGIHFYNASSDSSRLEYCSVLKSGWAGILCEYSSPIIIHCTIAQNSGTGIHCGCCSPRISYCEIVENSYKGIFCYVASPNITNTDIIGNSSSIEGGGIHCQNYSNPTIVNCTIENNISLISGGGGGVKIMWVSGATFINCLIANNSAPNSSGGGIRVSDCSSATLVNCIVAENICEHNGGGIYCHLHSNLTLMGCIICENTSTIGSGGGISTSGDSSIVIGNCIINGNTAFYSGGGSKIHDAEQFNMTSSIISNNTSIICGGMSVSAGLINDISNCIILNNIADAYGGGIGFSTVSYCDISYCTISGNIARTRRINGAGAGISCYWDSPAIRNCVVSSNSAVGPAPYGGGIWCLESSSPTIVNTIIEGNTGRGAIYFFDNLPMNVEYCDFHDNEGGNFIGPNIPPGLGEIVTVNGNLDSCDIYYNIFLDPEFVDPTLGEFHLQYGSHCVDAGDPSYLDPDSTVSDMGAFYNNQFIPVRVLLIPHEIPYLIPAEGGTMDYTIRCENIDDYSNTITVWCDVSFPDSTVFGPVLGPVTVTLDPGQIIERFRAQTVPASAPFGVYHYNAYAIVNQYTSSDSFMFGKVGTSLPGLIGWGNAGELLIDFDEGRTSAQEGKFKLDGAFPNPFNPSTVISFELTVACFLNLTVYDISGRKVAEPVNGWRCAGVHEVTFDGSDLASGIYLCRLVTGNFTASGKMVLIK